MIRKLKQFYQHEEEGKKHENCNSVVHFKTLKYKKTNKNICKINTRRILLDFELLFFSRLLVAELSILNFQMLAEVPN